MIPVLRKLSGLYMWYILVILTLGYLTAELGHFLVGVTSKHAARDVLYGDIACMLKEHILEERFNLTLQFACESAMNQSSCESLFDEGGEQYCEWDRNGMGIEYQILAGPSFIAVYTIGGVILGIAADKYKRVPMLAIAVLVCGVSILLIGTAKQYWHLIVLRMIFAAGEAALNPMATGVLSDIFPEDLRALVMSIFNWGIYGGIGFSFPVGRYISKWNLWNLGWRVTYYGSGILAIIIGILTATTLREPERTEIGEEKEEKDDPSNPASQQKVEGKKQENPWKVMLTPRFVMLCIAASIRHTAGLCFAYNCDQFYRVVFPHVDLSGWLFFVTCIVGGIGVLAGGYASDKLVYGMGVRSRVLILALSQLIATPFAFGSIYMGPVGSMVTLAISYLFAEMWFGILFAVLVEIVPLAVRSAAIGVFLFVMNNIGGNLPILMEPVRKATSFADALAIFYAGSYLLSSVLFLITALMMKKPKAPQADGEQNMNGVDNAAYANTEQNQNKVTESHYL